MPTITFIHPDGRTEPVEAETGDSAMHAAIVHGLDGIVAECGGSLVCATCHVYVDDAWIGRVGTVGDDEDELLGLAPRPSVRPAAGCHARSRSLRNSTDWCCGCRNGRSDLTIAPGNDRNRAIKQRGKR